MIDKFIENWPYSDSTLFKPYLIYAKCHLIKGAFRKFAA